MSSLQLAASVFEPMVLRLFTESRTVLRGMRDAVEHLLNQRTVSWLQPPVAMDVVSSMWSVVVTQRLVRADRRRRVASALHVTQAVDQTNGVHATIAKSVFK